MANDRRGGRSADERMARVRPCGYHVRRSLGGVVVGGRANGAGGPGEGPRSVAKVRRGGRRRASEWRGWARRGTTCGERSVERAFGGRANGAGGPVEGPLVAIARRGGVRRTSEWRGWAGGTTCGDRSGGGRRRASGWRGWARGGTTCGDRSGVLVAGGERMARVGPSTCGDRSVGRASPDERMARVGPWRDHLWRSLGGAAFGGRANGAGGPVEGPLVAIARRGGVRRTSEWRGWARGGTTCGDRSEGLVASGRANGAGGPGEGPLVAIVGGRRSADERMARVGPWWALTSGGRSLGVVPARLNGRHGRQRAGRPRHQPRGTRHVPPGARPPQPQAAQVPPLLRTALRRALGGLPPRGRARHPMAAPPGRAPGRRAGGGRLAPVSGRGLGAAGVCRPASRS